MSENQEKPPELGFNWPAVDEDDSDGDNFAEIVNKLPSDVANLYNQLISQKSAYSQESEERQQAINSWRDQTTISMEYEHYKAIFRDERFSDIEDKLLGMTRLQPDETIEGLIDQIATDREIQKKTSLDEQAIRDKLSHEFISDSATVMRLKGIALLERAEQVVEMVRPVWNELITVLDNRVDYPHMVENMLGTSLGFGELTNILRRRIPLRRVMDKGNSLDILDSIFEDYPGLLKSLQQQLQFVTNYILEKPIDNNDNQDIDFEDLVTLEADLKPWMDLSDRFTSMINSQREQVRQTALRLSTIIRRGSLDEGVDACIEAKKALKGLAEKYFSTWRQNDWLPRPADLPTNREVANQLGWVFLHLDAPDGNSLVYTAQDIEQVLLRGGNEFSIPLADFNFFPEYFLEGIAGVQFEHDTSFDFVADENYSELWFQVGRRLRRQQTMETLVHEVFENVAEKLGRQDLQDWLTLIEAENNSISWYSRYSRANDDIKHWEKEDFCDSAAMYVVRPDDLLKISGRRYDYMVELFASHMPADKATKYRQIRYGYKKLLLQSSDQNKLNECAQELMSHEQTALNDLKKDKVETKTLGRLANPEDKAVQQEGIKREGKVILLFTPVYLPTFTN